MGGIKEAYPNCFADSSRFAQHLHIALDEYEDYLRTNRAVAWSKDSKEAKYVRWLGSNPALKFDDLRDFAETRPGPVVANIAICLIHQTNYLLDQQLRRLEQDFLKEGGLRERMTKVRLESRAKGR